MVPKLVVAIQFYQIIERNVQIINSNEMDKLRVRLTTKKNEKKGSRVYEFFRLGIVLITDFHFFYHL